MNKWFHIQEKEALGITFRENQTPGDLRFGPYVIPLVYYTILMFVLVLPQNKKVLLIADQVETLCAS